MELEKSSYKVNMQTVIKASAFDRAMKLEAEMNKIHGRIIKLLDSIKGYEMESRRLRLEERKYNLAKQKLSGASTLTRNGRNHRRSGRPVRRPGNLK